MQDFPVCILYCRLYECGVLPIIKLMEVRLVITTDPKKAKQPPKLFWYPSQWPTSFGAIEP
jgi:hypothetical protein